MMKILISDDNKLLFEPFREIAYGMGIELHCATNWEDAQVKLETEDFSGLILDGKGELEEGSGANDTKHVMRGLGWLNQKYATGFFMPTIVYSAYVGEGNGSLEDIIDTKPEFILGVHSKEDPPELIFKKLKKYALLLPETRIKLEYSDIFKLFDDKRLPADMQPVILSILSSLSEKNIDKTHFNKIRDIIESMLKMANSIDKAFIPHDLLKPEQDGRPNLTACSIYLSGRETRITGSTPIKASSRIMDDHVSRIFSSITDVSQILSHNYSRQYSHYAYKSTTLGLLEVLLWYRDYLTSKYRI